jgi:hypothetical protein
MERWKVGGRDELTEGGKKGGLDGCREGWMSWLDERREECLNGLVDGRLN